MKILNFTLDLVDKLGIAIIVAIVSYYLAKRQLNNTNILQYRQKWIDDFRDGISLFISEAERISMLEMDDDRYFDYFKDFSQAQNNIELMLDIENELHNGVSEVMDEIRGIIHERKIDEEKLNSEIDVLLDTSKAVLKGQFSLIKRGK